MKEIVIFGTGEYAELAHYYFENDPAFYEPQKYSVSKFRD